MELHKLKKLLQAADNQQRDNESSNFFIFKNRAIFLLVRIFLIMFGHLSSIERVRSFVLQNRSFLPKELMIMKGDTVVQIGTHKQETIFRIAKAIGKNGRAIIIEASKENYTYLNQYTSKMGWDNIIIINKAASNIKGTQTFLVSKIFSDHRLEDDNILHDNDLRDSGYDRSETIDTDTTDNILNELGIKKVDYLEITVNGYELKVLEGMSITMKNTRKIYTKSFAIDKSKKDVIATDIIEILKNNGFNFLVGKPSKSVANDLWGERSGDIYAFKGNACG